MVQNNFHVNRMCNTNTNYHQFTYRNDIIHKLQKEHSLISMIALNLANYYENIRKYVTGK